MENTNIQPDYLNPESPLYYKGYRYEKSKYGFELWYDENGIKRKEIGYHNNGNKYYEGYYNENGEYHNEDGYAYQYWNINGEIKYQEYYLNGIYLTEQEWKEKTGK